MQPLQMTKSSERCIYLKTYIYIKNNLSDVEHICYVGENVLLCVMTVGEDLLICSQLDAQWLELRGLL